jgi:uncharacterized protein (DUF305 family)
MRHVLRTALAALALTVLTACGGTSGGSDHNDADEEFARQMIPHHQQAVMMARLADTNDAGPEVRALATRIAKAQRPEIETMRGWLEDWGSDNGHDMGDMGDMGSSDMPGMMSSTDMSALQRARGDAFDRLFLTQMIEHHRGAIEMAKTEQSRGKSKAAIKLAGSIEKAQTTEIAEMEQLLAG